MPRRGENIYKRKDGRWEARYVKEITADGKKKYGSVYASSYKEVKAKQQLRVLQPTENHNLLRITVTELIAEWLSSMKNQVKPCTYQKYECVCRNHIISDLGTIAVRYISRFTIMSFTEKLLEKNLSTKTVSEIVRYKPEQMAHLLNSKENWLLHEFLTLALDQFIDELAAEITGQDIMCTGVK